MPSVSALLDRRDQGHPTADSSCHENRCRPGRGKATVCGAVPCAIVLPGVSRPLAENAHDLVEFLILDYPSACRFPQPRPFYR